MFRFAAGAVIALLFSGSAFAQSAPYDWTGVYVGANGGFGWGLDDTVEFTYVPACLPAVGCPASVGINPEGFLAGGHIGANWQHNMWVLGIEGDADWTDINDSGTITTPGPSTATASTDLEWLATLRGRAGITADRALIYATGGLAFGEIDDRATLTSGSTAVIGLAGTWTGADNDTQVGWAAGGGIEFAATPNLIIGAEALYVDLGDNTVTLNQAPPVAAPVITADFEHQYVIVRGRLSWKW